MRDPCRSQALPSLVWVLSTLRAYPKPAQSPGYTGKTMLGQRFARITTLMLSLLLVSCPVGSDRQACSEDRSGDSRPSLVLVLTDDQRWNTLWAMPAVRRSL